MTGRRRVPVVYVPFALLTMFGPLLIMILQHDPVHAKPGALALEALLLLALARRSVFAWTLLLLWNLLLVVIGAPMLGTSIGVPLLLLLGLTCMVMQLTPAMRSHIGLRDGQAAAQPTIPL